MCYKQKCKVVSLNLAHPVYIQNRIRHKTYFSVIDHYCFVRLTLAVVVTFSAKFRSAKYA